MNQGKNSRFLQLTLTAKDTTLKRELDSLFGQLRLTQSRRVRRPSILPCLEIIILNCVKFGPDSTFSVSLSNKFYRGALPVRLNPRKITSEVMARVLSMLAEADLVRVEKGCLGKLRTRFTLNPAFKSVIEKLKDTKISFYEETLILKKSKKRRALYSDTRETHRMRKDLRLINESNQKYSFTINGERFDTDLKRIFIGNFRTGGRFYSEYQRAIDKKSRSKILIDGEPTSELDFIGMGINILYAISIKSAFKGDPYKLNGFNRSVCKQAMVVAINSRSKEEAIKTIQKALDRKETTGCAETLLSALESHHEAIRGLFYSQTWTIQQRIDSKIAESIMLSAATAGIPALCIHDAFIVPASKINWLIAESSRACLSVLGVDLPKKVSHCETLKAP